ncbi:MAG: hypothetical protein WAM26_17460 [Nitrososphaeraceae archaeon]
MSVYYRPFETCNIPNVQLVVIQKDGIDGALLDDGGGRDFERNDSQNVEIDRKLTEEFTLMREGSTTLLVPAESLRTNVPPRTPAFFNPAAKLSRDISTLMYNSFVRLHGSLFEKVPITLADAFSGIGARAIRVAREIPSVDKVILNDLNPVAISAARKSAKINDVEDKCAFSQKDVHVFLNERNSKKKERYVIVDLDPFGSPSPYVDSLVRAVADGGLVSVTATDTAVLYGKYPKVCFRKYGSKPINCSYSNEIAVRILISLIGLVAGRMDLSIEPVFAHSHRHYSRVYVKVHVNSNEANKLIDNLGYITHCFNCGGRKDHRLVFPSPLSCSTCGKNNNADENKLSIAGPLWIKPIFNKRLIADILRADGNTYSDRSIDVSRDDYAPAPKYRDTNLTLGDHNNSGYETERSLLTQSPLSIDSGQASSQKYFHKIFQLFHIAGQELDDQPYYYTIDEVGSAMKTSPSPMNTFLERLSQGGFRASRTSFRPTGFKTNASLEEIKKLL